MLVLEISVTRHDTVAILKYLQMTLTRLGLLTFSCTEQHRSLQELPCPPEVV